MKPLMAKCPNGQTANKAAFKQRHSQSFCHRAGVRFVGKSYAFSIYVAAEMKSFWAQKTRHKCGLGAAKGESHRINTNKLLLRSSGFWQGTPKIIRMRSRRKEDPGTVRLFEHFNNGQQVVVVVFSFLGWRRRIFCLSFCLLWANVIMIFWMIPHAGR